MISSKYFDLKFPDFLSLKFLGGNGDPWNSNPNSYDPQEWKSGSNRQLATFGAGCYWGTEKYFAQDFAQRYPPGAIIGTSVGFMSADPNAISNPSYRQVCSGNSGHVEVLQILYNPSFIPYSDMVRFFFTFHDPTTLDQQGNDHGPQYASVIFTHD